MSLALEILAQRKHAGLSAAFTRQPSSYSLTNYGRIERDGPPKLLPSLGGIKLPERMAPSFPPHIVEANQKSQAQVAQVQDIMKAYRAKAVSPPEPALSQADRDARHAATVSSIKDIEAKRAAPKMAVPPDPNWPPKAIPPPPAPRPQSFLSKLLPRSFNAKTACFDYPALEVMRLRAA